MEDNDSHFAEKILKQITETHIYRFKLDVEICSLCVCSMMYTQIIKFATSNFSSANKCLLKVAQFAAQLERYERAVEIYEEVSSVRRRER